MNQQSERNTKNQICADCQYLGDKFSFPMPNNKVDVDKENPMIKHYYCCCGDCNKYNEDVSVMNIRKCNCYENIDS